MEEAKEARGKLEDEGHRIINKSECSDVTPDGGRSTHAGRYEWATRGFRGRLTPNQVNAPVLHASFWRSSFRNKRNKDWLISFHQDPAPFPRCQLVQLFLLHSLAWTPYPLHQSSPGLSLPSCLHQAHSPPQSRSQYKCSRWWSPTGSRSLPRINLGLCGQ
ncbi:hypothetical protein BJX76DRAFT_167188 [Aspergillus varians]